MVKIIKINEMDQDNKSIEIARKAMKQGSIVVYPTDTVYGIGANIFDEKAILKVYSVKKRTTGKPLSICLSSIKDLEMVAYLDQRTKKFAGKILPGPYTLILKKKDEIPSILTAGSDYLGVRIPDSKICQQLSVDFPITSTSANLSGQTVPESPEDILKQLGSRVDVLLDAGVCKYRLHSTVIDMTVYPPKILRKGAGYQGLNRALNGRS